VTTFGWLAVTLLTPAEDADVLRRFSETVRPTIGWSGHGSAGGHGSGRFQLQLLCMVIGCFAVYAALFATGSAIYGNTLAALAFGVLSAVCFSAMALLWRKAA
jgi:hypothetical protein